MTPPPLYHQLCKNDIPLKLIFLRALKDAGGPGYIAELGTCATSLENLKDYTDDLRKLYVKRELVRAGAEISAAGFDEDAEAGLAQAEQALLNIRLDNNPAQELDTKELVRMSLDRFEDALLNRGKLRGIATGFVGFDQKTRGLRPGQLVVVAARPGYGKTSFALNIADRVACDDSIPVGVISLEMTSEELTSRLISSRSRVPSDKLESGNISESDQPKIAAAAGRIARAPLHFCDEGGLTISQVRARARRMAMRHGIKLLVVDYLQLMRSSRRENRTVEITEISNGLKALAKELRMPIVALSQLNREVERDGKREPRLSDLRDSGSVEQDADMVCFLHPTTDQTDDPVPVELLIRKHRNGPVGKVPLLFFKRWTRFETATREQ